MLLLMLLSLSALPGCIAQSNNDWEAAPSLQNGETLYACVGESVTFGWKLNPKGSLVNFEEMIFQYQKETDFLKLNLLNSESIAVIDFPENNPERVLIPSDKQYAGRIEVNKRVMTIKNVNVADSGLYSMVVKGRNRTPGTKKTISSTIILIVADDIMTTDKKLHISESAVAFLNQTTGRHHKVLECGQFTYKTQPPFDIAWKVPGMSMPRSTEYRVSDGRFRLVLPLRMGTGSYGCSVTKDNAVRACAKALVHSDMRLDATDSRFWLVGEDLASTQAQMKSNNDRASKGRGSQASQIAALQTKNNEMTNKITTMKAEEAKTNEKVDQLIERMASLETELRNKENQLSNRNDQLTEKIKELEEKSQNQQKDLNRKGNAISELGTRVRCESKTITTYNKVTHPDYNMYRGSNGGFDIVFQREFPVVPQVIVAHAFMESSANAALRMTLKTTGHTRKGFRLITKTWSTSQVYGWSINYMACY